MGSYFSLARWQKLELQASIFRSMLAGAAIPPELLQPIKRSLHHSPPYFHHHPLQHFQPACKQSGYWGRAAMDPESARCRRTDGKRWRCSRDVVADQEYCERHMHRGRNRSRKPVELPKPPPTGGAAGGGGSLHAATSISSPNLATASLESPFDLLRLNECSSGTKNDGKSLSENQDRVDGDDRSDGHILRHYLDDWPRSLQEPDNAESNGGRISSAACLSISMPGNTVSDVSLKLSTGDAEQLQLNWAGGCASANQGPSMGGPLAEALGSSTSTSSTTSVLVQLPCSSVS